MGREDVRAVWLSAEGEDFSQGADLKDPQLTALVTTSDATRQELALKGAAMLELWDNLPMPTVVSARGRIIGSGAGLVCASDFRVLGEHTALHFPEVDRGMYLSWGMLPLLVRELGAPMTRRLAVAGVPVPCERFPPGFCRIKSPERVDEVAQGQALTLASKPPLAVRSILGVLRALARGETVTQEQGAELFAQTAGSADFGEAISAWMQGRKGNFEGR